MRVGIIGASPERGWAPRAHIPALRALPDFELVAVATSREESARQAAEVFGVPLAFTNATELAQHPAVDLVVVTVKVAAHAGLVRAAIAAGKDVYCEWPLALSVGDAADLEQAAREAGSRAFVGLQGRFSPGVAYVRDQVRAGAIGRITSVRLSSSRSKGSATAVPGWTAYTYDDSSGAGLVEVLGGHALDLIEHVAGPIGRLVGHATVQHPDHTIAETGELIHVTAPDTLDVIGELTGGAAFSAHLHDGEPGVPATRLEITGTDGTMTVESAPDDNPWAAQLQISDFVVRRDAKPLDIPASYRTTPGLAVEPASVARLYRQIARSPGDVPTFATAVRLHRLIDTARRRPSVHAPVLR
ncbi:Gfo/Idh/MocA family protein [Kribbella sp. NPDC051586]|uniref:Gfo/Idh/MocA family protein n=1 Tax=Kribbella sp. NPDC051586 TaxID=3364118 RepID=UPI00379F6C15